MNGWMDEWQSGCGNVRKGNVKVNGKEKRREGWGREGGRVVDFQMEGVCVSLGYGKGRYVVHTQFETGEQQHTY